jgi:hypothetical protein
MMEDARQDVLERHVGKTTMYSCTGADWRELGEEDYVHCTGADWRELGEDYVHCTAVQELTGESQVRTMYTVQLYRSRLERAR